MAYDFLLASFEGGGSIPTATTAIRRLTARGHRVRVLLDEAARDDIEAAGATFVPWTAVNRAGRTRETDPLFMDVPDGPWTPQQGLDELQRVLDRLTIGPSAAYAADTLAELERAPADAVVSIDILWGPLLAARAAGVPAATLAGSGPMYVEIPGVPPAGPGFPPPRTEAERAEQAGVAAWFADQVNARLPVLNATRAGVGLAPLGHALDQMQEVDLHLIATSRAFDFPSTGLPPNLRYLGPLLDQPMWARSWTSPWPADDTRPLVLVAMSTTFQNQAGVIQSILDAAADLPVRVLATLGPALVDARLRAPDNAVLVAAAAHDEVMREATVVVTHCGHGTVMRALANGRPMLCLPMGRDQNDNAARVAARGAGIRLSPDAGAAALREALAALLADLCYAQAAAALGRAIAAAEPEDALVDALESLAGRARAAAA
ncbi:MGT family glycosyltransferase [Roseiarcus fermentans]|uniref:MGT family glycosyltransferase n=1 Tax=Roseiarcus fermentans TaxID=1473586 RepID=A0A366EXF5_9HYPH|nr:nucleotide disphospho-sugar-binding domain-containing protein [Roseiarcus fermentans]RBP07083.1 MGT family glycosyltransferase [Roseiarcus fermentans]